MAVAVAARHPELVRRLVLVAPAGLAPRAVGVAALLGAAAELATQARSVLGYQLADHTAARWAMFAATVADPGALHPDDARLILAASDGGRRIADGVRQALAADLRDDLAAAPMPVGLIWGTDDRVVPYSGLEALRELRPDAAVETLAGHRPHPAGRAPGGVRRRARPAAGAPRLACRRVRRLLLLASAIVFVDTTFYAAITPLLPGFEEEYGLGKSGAGVLAAAYPAGTFLGALPGGYLAARAGVRATVLLGLGLMSVSSVAFAFGDSILVLDIARFAQGVGGAASWAGAMAWVATRRAARPARRDARHDDGRGGRRRAARARWSARSPTCSASRPCSAAPRSPGSHSRCGR